MLFGVLRFFWQAVNVIRDYNAGFASGVAFFALCVIAGLSFFALTCAVVTAAGVAVVGGAALLLQNAAQQQRLRERQHRD